MGYTSSPRNYSQFGGGKMTSKQADLYIPRGKAID